jgi:WD40 repeat protein
MNELSAFERRLSAGLEAIAGPRRDVDATAIARTAASRAPVQSSMPSRFSALTGYEPSGRGRRLGGLGVGRGPRPLVVFAVVALILALALGALAVGSGLVRLTSVLPPPSLEASLLTSTPPAKRAASWTPTAPMTTNREDQTATLLLDGGVLVAGGGKDPASAELYDPRTGRWTATGSMSIAHLYDTATLLPDGRVLVVGGNDGTGRGLASAELYDPRTGTWTATGSMTMGRVGPTATLLPNGKVLVAGGDSEAIPLASAELYDPRTGSWTATGAMVAAGGGYTATLLPDGNVLVTFAGLTTAELYDSDTGTWATTGSMLNARGPGFTSTLLPNSKVLVAGGTVFSETGSLLHWPDPLASTELYDPGTGTWTATGAMIEARDSHVATLLSDGQVLVAGGCGGGSMFCGYVASAELYDPRTGTWAATAPMVEARVSHTATLLPDGTVLVVGGGRPGSGVVLASAELYHPGTSR